MLLALAGLSLISLALFGYIAFTNMKDLGQFALDASVSLGDKVVRDSKHALEKQIEEHLLRTAKDQAALSNALLKKVQDQVNIMAKYAGDLWQRKASGRQRRSYSQSEKPADIYAASFYFIAGDIAAGELKEEIEFSSGIDDIFVPVLANDANLDSVSVGTESGLMRGYPWISALAPTYDHRQRSWYKKTVEKGDVVWSETYIDATDNDLIVTCSKPFYDTAKNLLGAVEADVTLKDLNEKILSTQVGKAGYVFLIDHKGKIIAHPGLKVGNTKWDEKYITENLLASKSREVREITAQMIAGKTGVHRFSGDPIIEGDDKYIAYAPLEITGWSIGVVLPVSEVIAPALATQKKILRDTRNTKTHISSAIKKVQVIFISIFLIITLVVILVAVWISRQVTRPIVQLSQGAKVVGEGNLDYQFDIKTGDEIEDLAVSFNNMTLDLKEFMAELQRTTAAKERIESELEIARQIQTSMLPRIFPPFPARGEIDVFAMMQAAKEVGGDFYDFFLIGENKLGFLIGDVSGKGVPAALFMAISKALLKTEALRGLEPDQVLFEVNRNLYPDNDACMFVTLFCAVMDLSTGEVQYASAGHNPPLIFSAPTGFDYLSVPKDFVVGPMPDTEYETKSFMMQPGDMIFLYTDGVTEAMNPENKMFTEEKLKNKLNELTGKDVTEVIHGIHREVKTFARDAEQSDDITMLTVKYCGAVKT